MFESLDAIRFFVGNHLGGLLIAATFASGGFGMFIYLTSDNRSSRTARGFFLYLFPLRHWFSSSTKIDILFYLLTKISFQWVTLPAGILTVFAAGHLARSLETWTGWTHKVNPGPVSVLAMCIVLFVAGDLGLFLSHYIQHKNKYLWKFHEVHHSAVFLTPITTLRIHPVSLFLDSVIFNLCSIIPATLLIFIYRISIADLLIMQGATTSVFSFLVLGALQHSHFPISFGVLDRLLISPRMHQVHHSVARQHWDKNMGFKLSIWDWIAGTAYLASKDEIERFGITSTNDNFEQYNSTWGCLWHPIGSCAVLMSKRSKRIEVDRVEEGRGSLGL